MAKIDTQLRERMRSLPDYRAPNTKMQFDATQFTEMEPVNDAARYAYRDGGV